VSFENLSKKLQEILAKKRFSNPTEIQKRTIKHILNGKQSLVISETGSGKTEAVMLPLLDLALKSPEKRIFCIYITPLKALNRDIFERILSISSELGLDVDIRHGDTSSHQRSLQLADPPNILITTPESFQGFLIGKKMRELLKNLEYVVIDEIHEIIGNKRGEQLLFGLERLKNVIGKNFKRIGISATLKDSKTISDSLNGSNLEKLNIIRVESARKPQISVFWPHEVSEENENFDWFSSTLKAIKELSKEKDGTIVFVNTRNSAEILGAKLKESSSRFEVHHGSLSKESRLNAEKGLKNRNIGSIVATSSLALGIDVGHINQIIQISSPRRIEAFVQRIGRAGHSLSKESKGTIIVSDEDDALEACAIAKLTLLQVLEEKPLMEGSLDVLANQIVAMGFEGTYTKDIAFETAKKVVPFCKISRNEFDEVFNLLLNLRLIKITENETYSIKKAAFGYFFSNMSMIKDRKKLQVVKFSSRERIADIDEDFAAEIDISSTFVCRGSYWRVISKEGAKVFVEEALAAENVPEWAGELMPVDYIVARQVNLMRSYWPTVKEEYSELVDNFSIEKITADYSKCGRFPENEIGIELGPDFFVLRSFFGNRVNETVGRLLSSYFSLKSGESVGFRADAYRILIKLPGKVNEAEIFDFFKGINEDYLEKTLRTVVRNSAQFKQKFIHIAKKFGVVSSDAVFSKLSIQKLVDAYEGTPVFEETLAEYFFEKMDLNKAKIIIRELRENRISLKTYSEITPFSKRFLEKYSPELVFSGLPLAKIHQIVSKRLEEKKVTVACANCLAWLGQFSVKNIDFKCPSCGSGMIGILSKENRSLLSKKELGKQESAVIQKFKKTANLYLTYGNRAFFVLSGHGIGPEIGGRILGKTALLGSPEVVNEIINAEKNFARTRIFWDKA